MHLLLLLSIIYYVLCITAHQPWTTAPATSQCQHNNPRPGHLSSCPLSAQRPAPSASKPSSGLWATCQKPNAISGGPVARCPAVAGFPFSRFCLPPPSLPASCIYAVRLVAVARVSDQCRMSCASIVSHIHRSHQPQCRPAFVLSSH
jgi:hypothetical protein